MLFQFWNSCPTSCNSILWSRKGDEILVPCITYVATYQAISATGAKPVLCDIDPKNLNIDLNNLKKITKKTKAIIPVHFSGHPCNLDEIYAFSKK